MYCAKNVENVLIPKSVEYDEYVENVKIAEKEFWYESQPHHDADADDNNDDDNHDNFVNDEGCCYNDDYFNDNDYDDDDDDDDEVSKRGGWRDGGGGGGGIDVTRPSKLPLGGPLLQREVATVLEVARSGPSCHFWIASSRERLPESKSWRWQ